MTVTPEPRGLTWINNLNNESFGSLVSQTCWLFGSFLLTIADFHMLTSGKDSTEDAGVFLAGILVAAWTGKSVAGVFDKDNKRKANPKYAEVLEAQERGKVAGAAAAAVVAETKLDLQAARGRVRTAEHLAQPTPTAAAPKQEMTVNVGAEVVEAAQNSEKPVTTQQPTQPPEEPEWAQGDPRGGIL